MCECEGRPRERTWRKKFADAFHGVAVGVRGQRSFVVHLVMSIGVIVCAAAFRVAWIEWCLLILCITAVLVAEMFNSALEFLARAITDRHDSNVGAALDIGSAAVLVASIGSVLVGSIVFLTVLFARLGWW